MEKIAEYLFLYFLPFEKIENNHCTLRMQKDLIKILVIDTEGWIEELSATLEQFKEWYVNKYY